MTGLLPPERLAALLIELRERADAAKHSPWTFSPQEGEAKHCDQAQIWDENGHSLAVLEPTLIPQLATDTAAHIAGLHPEIIIALLDHISALTREIESEREARFKTDAALRMKDDAVGTLIARLQRLGDNCEDLIP